MIGLTHAHTHTLTDSLSLPLSLSLSLSHTHTHIHTQTHKQDGWTALHWAAEKGHVGVSEALLKAGCNAHIQNKAHHHTHTHTHTHTHRHGGR